MIFSNAAEAKFTKLKSAVGMSVSMVTTIYERFLLIPGSIPQTHFWHSGIPFLARHWIRAAGAGWQSAGREGTATSAAEAEARRRRF